MVEVDEQGIRERQDGAVVVNLAAAQVVSARLEHGFQAERPWLALLLIVPLVAFGGLCFVGFVRGAPGKLLLSGSFGLVLGALVSWHTFRRGPVVVVETTMGTRRVFPTREQVESVRASLIRFAPR